MTVSNSINRIATVLRTRPVHSCPFEIGTACAPYSIDHFSSGVFIAVVSRLRVHASGRAAARVRERFGSWMQRVRILSVPRRNAPIFRGDPPAPPATSGSPLAKAPTSVLRRSSDLPPDQRPLLLRPHD